MCDDTYSDRSTNQQDTQAISFDGMVRACAVAAGKNPDGCLLRYELKSHSTLDVKIVHYDPKNYDFGKKKAFPMRPQHFFTSVEKAMTVRLQTDIPFLLNSL